MTGDWNPVLGCQRHSKGCRKCWFFDGILPWQQRLGNLPKDLKENQVLVMEERMTVKNLRPKRGIVGVVQHGDLFWDKMPDAAITRVLDIVDEAAAEKSPGRDGTKYVLWTKRAERMADFLAKRYPDGVPDHIGCAVSVEDQKTAESRLPHLLRVKGRRFIVIEPMLGPIDLAGYLDVDWVLLGSETGKEDTTPLDPDWARKVRDQVTARAIPFFIKQLGTNHKKSERELDGRTWGEFPKGYVKNPPAKPKADRRKQA